MHQHITLTVNGQLRELRADPDQSLLDALRYALDLKATRLGCGQGQCGACTVLIEGRAVTACDTPLGSVHGKTITTLEGLGSPQSPHPLQTAFIEEQALQCGYCTSGLLMRAAELVKQDPPPDEAAIRLALDRNLCRCGVHPRVVRAILQVMRPTHGEGRP